MEKLFKGSGKLWEFHFAKFVSTLLSLQAQNSEVVKQANNYDD